jgi:DNA-binding XRE family transcriptional regulator
MKIEKYFWSLNKKALKEVKKILKDPEHPKFISYAFTLLSQCDVPKEVFSVIKKEHFIEQWPKIKKYWDKTGEAVDFKTWWDTIYYTLLQKRRIQKKIETKPMTTLIEIGRLIKKARIQKGWSQKDLAEHSGLKQPHISLIEKGKENLTIETLAKIAKVLDIDKIELKFS